MDNTLTPQHRQATAKSIRHKSYPTSAHVSTKGVAVLNKLRRQGRPYDHQQARLLNCCKGISHSVVVKHQKTQRKNFVHSSISHKTKLRFGLPRGTLAGTSQGTLIAPRKISSSYSPSIGLLQLNRVISQPSFADVICKEPKHTEGQATLNCK